ncbi:MAG: hypothetical protein HY270_13035 [Deltaproteobacteria bacterium]|nr:hypothetical protein [Deltaproteobacteria bacterium]
MDRNQIMRRALWTTAFLNLGGAALFAFPDSVGRLAGMPAPAPRLYTSFLAFIVVMFGVTYAWLARQPRIDRAVVTLSAIGKAGFFFVAFSCWLLGDLAGKVVLAASGDLLFASIFVWWLVVSAEV